MVNWDLVLDIPNMLICDYTGVKAGNSIEQR